MRCIRARAMIQERSFCVLGQEADVAQLVEHSLGKGEVISSILIIGSRDWLDSIGEAGPGLARANG